MPPPLPSPTDVAPYFLQKLYSFVSSSWYQSYSNQCDIFICYLIVLDRGEGEGENEDDEEGASDEGELP